ncbi:MAG: hypothetical protein HQK55_13315 [Deltaproteobacteria bacterium]|nr:hypothetical protein [Deltaproteobacteria bacterium]
MNRKRMIFSFIFFFLALNLTAGPVQADWEWIMDGKITAAPHKTGELTFIGVNNINFMVMPNSLILHRKSMANGINNEDRISIDHLSIGQNVLVAHEGSRIFQIVLVK